MDVEKVMVKDMSSLPWVERYRPSCLEDLISHNHIIGTSNLFLSPSKEVHRREEPPKPSLLWSTRNRKNINNSGMCEDDVWKELQHDGT